MFKPEDIVAGLTVKDSEGLMFIVSEQKFNKGNFILVSTSSWECTIGTLDSSTTAKFFNNEGFVRYEPTCH